MAINEVDFDELEDAPPRRRAQLARSGVTLSMDGNKKIGQYPILRNGEYISISVQMNTLTKFSKLQVGKYVITAKEKKGSNM